MANLFNLKILTPEKQFYDGDAISVAVTTVDGRYEILAHHVPMVMPITVGTIDFMTPDGPRDTFNSEGFLEVRPDEVLVFVQACESPEEIDARRAEEALQRAEERMRQKQSMQEYRSSKLALARAMARLQLSKHDTFHGHK